MHNEGAIVSELSAKIEEFLQENPKQFFLLVCDNCSDETLPYLASRFSINSNVYVISKLNQAGYGNAIRFGLSFAHSIGFDWAVTLDSDLSNPLEEANELMKLANSLSRDSEIILIKGNRFSSFKAGLKSAPTNRLPFTYLANLIARFLTLGISRDPTNGFRAIKLSWFVQNEFSEPGFASIVEELAVASQSRNSICDFDTFLSFQTAIRSTTSFTLTYPLVMSYLKHLIKIFPRRIRFLICP